MALIGKNFAFFHMPRTGGTYVRHVFRLADPDSKEVWPGHCLPGDLARKPGQHRFTILRDIESWKASWETLREEQKEHLSKGIPEILLEEVLRVPQIWAAYASGVDEVLWTDDLDAQLPGLLTRLGFDAEKVLGAVPSQVHALRRIRRE